MITFTGEALDRMAERRGDPAWVAEQARSPSARAVLAGDAGVHVTADDRLALVPLGHAGGEPLLLGVDDAGPVFAVDVDAPVDGRVPPLIAARGEGEPHAALGTRPIGLRLAAASLPHADGGLAAHAAALINWHRRHRFCAACGAPTAVGGGGILRSCARCGTQHHPRTDPVVIMLVTDGAERVLLGRQRSWPPGRYSALAGFVEPGESLEAAVAREVREEAGVEVGPPRYMASQPWPFPSSLMIAFVAPWESGEPRRIDDELDDLRWFSRADVAAALRGEPSPLATPPPFAIAARLLAGWLA
jgi:NAD+ diphosphatase